MEHKNQTENKSETVELLIYRYNPEKDKKPYFQKYSVEITPQEVKLLDLLTKLKTIDDSLSFRRSCREGICGSDGMNINGIHHLILTDQPDFVNVRDQAEGHRLSNRV